MSDMEQISIMVSSTMKDLQGERDAILTVFEHNEYVRLIGAAPYANTSRTFSSAFNTLEMAKTCDLYLLILGNQFGSVRRDGRSATEAEYDAAYHDDPTKILVFRKDDGSPLDPEQSKFISRVCDYQSGYWRTTFQYTHQLQSLVKESFMLWLKERASIGKSLTYVDHFIRLAVNRKPVSDATVLYAVKDNYIDIEYRFLNRHISVQFEKETIYRDFWGCLYKLDEQLSL